MVESQPSKLLVAGSIPVSRSILRSRFRRRLPTVARVHDTLRANVGLSPWSYGWQAIRLRALDGQARYGEMSRRGAR